MDAVSLVMLLETTKSVITNTIKVNRHFFADGDGLKLVSTPGTSASFTFNAIVAAEGLNVCQNDQVELSTCQLETVIQIK